jgi:hypothetical protein
MGGFDNISRRSLGGVAVLLATCLCATSAMAETPADETVQAPLHHAVSTSPNPPAALAPIAGSPAGQSPVLSAAPELPPLTRAAARLRIEEMSPVRWLAHYGNVSIGQRE